MFELNTVCITAILTYVLVYRPQFILSNNIIINRWWRLK